MSEKQEMSSPNKEGHVTSSEKNGMNNNSECEKRLKRVAQDKCENIPAQNSDGKSIQRTDDSVSSEAKISSKAKPSDSFEKFGAVSDSKASSTDSSEKCYIVSPSPENGSFPSDSTAKVLGSFG